MSPHLEMCTLQLTVYDCETKHFGVCLKRNDSLRLAVSALQLAVVHVTTKVCKITSKRAAHQHIPRG